MFRLYPGCQISVKKPIWACLLLLFYWSTKDLPTARAKQFVWRMGFLHQALLLNITFKILSRCCWGYSTFIYHLSEINQVLFENCSNSILWCHLPNLMWLINLIYLCSLSFSSESLPDLLFFLNGETLIELKQMFVFFNF